MISALRTEPHMFRNRTGWTLTVKVWVDRRGVKVLGPGRAELLGHIDRHHSISAAAKLMGMSYRRAWSLVRAINAAAGEPIVAAAKGGAGGGGADLTPAGRDALAAYQKLVARLAAAALKS
jgi:molybdate transport system regulatory protein